MVHSPKKSSSRISPPHREERAKSVNDDRKVIVLQRVVDQMENEDPRVIAGLMLDVQKVNAGMVIVHRKAADQMGSEDPRVIAGLMLDVQTANAGMVIVHPKVADQMENADRKGHVGRS